MKSLTINLNIFLFQGIYKITNCSLIDDNAPILLETRYRVDIRLLTKLVGKKASIVLGDFKFHGAIKKKKT